MRPFGLGPPGMGMMPIGMPVMPFGEESNCEESVD